MSVVRMALVVVVSVWLLGYLRLASLSDGYDLSKVFIGSLGTLGIITEINMRTYPLPEYESTLIIQSNNLDKLRDIVEDIQKYSYPGGLELIKSNFGEQFINSEYEWNI